MTKNRRNLSGGGWYSAVGEGQIAGLPIYKGYLEMTPPIFKGSLLNTTIGGVSCGPQASLNGGKRKKKYNKSKRKYRKTKSTKSKKSKKSRKSKKNKRKTKKRTYRK